MEREAARSSEGGHAPEAQGRGVTATQSPDLRAFASSIGNRGFGKALGDPRSPLSRALVQRDAMGGMAELARREPKKKLQALVSMAATHGLPTRFVSVVLKHYSISEADVGEHETNELLNEITFKSGTTASGLKAMQLGVTPLSASYSGDLGAIFHEATHAYLDVAESDPKVQAFLAAGTEHYQGATVGDEITTDPGTLLSEAAGNYVGNRITYWWRGLIDLAAQVALGPVSEDTLNRLRSEYENRTAERIFGYDEKGGTDRPMSEEIKQFLDGEILENKIPDKFDDVPAFKQLLNLG